MGRPRKDGSPAVLVNKQGRPRYKIDYEKLNAMCQIHCTEVECAYILGINIDTLAEALKRDGHGSFPEYFKKASAGGKMSLRRRQYKSAMDGSVPMLIWLGKNWLGQKDNHEDQNINSIDKIDSIFAEFSKRLPN